MWFPHMWNHIQPHLYSNTTALMLDMLKNKDFAKVTKLDSKISNKLEIN